MLSTEDSYWIDSFRSLVSLTRTQQVSAGKPRIRLRASPPQARSEILTAPVVAVAETAITTVIAHIAPDDIQAFDAPVAMQPATALRPRVKIKIKAEIRALAHEPSALEIDIGEQALPRRKRGRPRKDEAHQISGMGRIQFHFRDDILEQLDDYFESIRLMRLIDPEHYALYAKIGASIASRNNACMARSLSVMQDEMSGGIDELPAFSCVFFSKSASKGNGDDILIPARFAYTTKIKGQVLEGLEPARHDETIFSVSTIYDYRGKPAHLCFHVGVSVHGVRALKEKRFDRQEIRHRQGDTRVSYASHVAWRHSGGLVDMLQEKGWRNKPGATVHDVADFFFATAISANINQERVFQVRADNGHETAAFAISVGRAPYFFKDREIEVNENGQRRRIFHFIEGYTRSDGVEVRAHTKGLRGFDWNGYRMHIGMSDFDFNAPSRLSSGTVIETPSIKTLGFGQLGAFIREHILELEKVGLNRKQRNSLRRFARRTG